MKSDDSSLPPQELAAVDKRAVDMLHRAAVWGRFPTPVDDVLEAAKLRVAPANLFDPAGFMAYVKAKGQAAMSRLRSALDKVLGIYDAQEQVIHIDDSVGKSKQTFLKLHETGHHEMPTHRKVFTFFQDCQQTLAPDIADQLEREANNFARIVLFQGQTFRDMAAQHAMSVRTPLKLAGKFGASIYASAREFVRTHHRGCMVYVLEPVEIVSGGVARASVRRVECSAEFTRQFGTPRIQEIRADGPLGRLLPIMQKFAGPAQLRLADRNGDIHECVGEAFNTTHNVILLIYTLQALQGPVIAVPASYRRAAYIARDAAP